MTEGSSLLRPGATCWRVEHAGRVAFLVDNEAYFAAAKAAMLKARHSIQLLGWEFDPRRRLVPDAPTTAADRIGDLLAALAAARPELDVRLLIWNAALGVSLGKRMMPQRAQLWFRKSRVRFRLDSTIPRGASHHQKLLVIDDAIAFCAGDDFGANRWDRPAHLDHDPDRHTPGGRSYPPRHGMTMLVDGAAARALGELARARWQHATGTMGPAAAGRQGDPWPDGVAADLADVGVGISRTMPAWRDRSEVREIEALHLDGIGAARRLLYIENQYFASARIGEAIERRLRAPDCPEIIVVTGEHAPSFFDRMTMDPARDALIRRLRAADRKGRFQIYAPHAPAGRPMLVHSKVMIVDDRLVRIGSSNIADRSLGYDSECDLAIAPADAAGRATIAGLRHRLIAHFLDREAEEVRRAAETRGLAGAVEALERPGTRRLRPLAPPAPRFPRSLVAAYHLGDPYNVAEAWRPWRRN